MIVPSFVRLRYWFYPTGNTPAVNLVRDRVPPPNACTKILCLASGDIRNILFTLWTERESNGCSFDFTACDMEPAIIARNALLLSFLIDAASRDTTRTEGTLPLWELYYHFFVTSNALRVLKHQLTRLLDASSAVEEWNQSSYGAILSFLSKDTLQEARRFWQLYLDACDDGDSSGVRATIREIMDYTELHKEGFTMRGQRALGIHALGFPKVLDGAFRAYWRSGVVAGNQIDASALKAEGGGYVNPLMALSTAPLGKFAVHYGTDPLLGFHLAEAFDKPVEESEALELLATIVKSQFSSWCESFTGHVQKRTIRLRFYCGEALNLCYGLQRHAPTGPNIPAHLYTYARPWSSPLLELDVGSAMGERFLFDVIDSSNISDHVGILNLLPAALPLLRGNTFAVLYTETLLRGIGQAAGYLDEVLRADTGPVCLLMGVAPTTSLLGTSTEHFGSETIMSHFGRQNAGQTQKRVRIAWKRAYGGDPLVSDSNRCLSADARGIALFFFKWYLNMFSPRESVAAQLSMVAKKGVSPLSYDLGLYTRTTLVALLGLARKHIYTDWQKCISELLQHIETDRTLMIGSNAIQELFMLLHLSGLYKVAAFEMSPKAVAAMAAASLGCSSLTKLARYPALPNIIAIALVVPRQKLNVFTYADLDKIGTPSLHISVGIEGLLENCYHAIHACFGKLILAENSDTTSIEEDIKGWKGQSTLVVTCMLPASQLLIGGRGDIRVALKVNHSMATPYFIRILGMHMRIFDTSINDQKNLHLLSSLPGRPEAPTAVLSQPTCSTTSVEPAISVTPKDGRIELLTVRHKFLEESEHHSLASGSMVGVHQESPCTMTLKLEEKSKLLRFPFPVDGSRSKTRVSRKQHWTEVTVPISFAMQMHGYALRPFPVVMDRGQLAAWGMGRINLIDQPVITTRSLDKLMGFLAMTISQRERSSQQDTATALTFTRSLFDMKESIIAMFDAFANKGNHHGALLNAFRLARDDDSDTLIFVNALRHDKELGSICLDARIVPLTNARVRKLSGALTKVTREAKILTIKINEEERIMWKHIMPALVERCRYSWQHKSTCEYGMSETPNCPRSLVHGEASICSCGEGRDISDMPKEYAAFSPYATKIAISPLSALPYVELMEFEASLAAAGKSENLPQRAATDETCMKKNKEAFCDHCGTVKANLKSCAGCGLVKYCDRNCQVQAWKGHKTICKGKN